MYNLKPWSFAGAPQCFPWCLGGMCRIHDQGPTRELAKQNQSVINDLGCSRPGFHTFPGSFFNWREKLGKKVGTKHFEEMLNFSPRPGTLQGELSVQAAHDVSNVSSAVTYVIYDEQSFPYMARALHVRKRLPVKTQLVCPGNDEENWSSEVQWQLDGRNMEHSKVMGGN